MAEKKEKEETPEDAYEAELSSGVYIFMMLGVLTVGEFLVASIAAPWVFILWAVALWKSYLVVKDYMHVGHVFSDEETH